MNNYYTYAYLREDGTPYYIGKGKGKRIKVKSKIESIKPPKDKSRIIFLKQNLTEEEAFNHEKYMIAVFGRKDLGTGILRNKTNGGEGASGAIKTQETRMKMSKSQKGKIVAEETRKKQSESHKGDKNFWYGKTLSDEHKIKLREAKKGNKNPNFGKTFSEEHRKKLGEAKKKYWTDKKLSQES